ncbi:hypothetical protein JYF55_001950 [Campylobacter coli]|nr:hypothetical protein [Campylobacter coli]
MLKHQKRMKLGFKSFLGDFLGGNILFCKESPFKGFSLLFGVHKGGRRPYTASSL